MLCSLHTAKTEIYVTSITRMQDADTTHKHTDRHDKRTARYASTTDKQTDRQADRQTQLSIRVLEGAGFRLNGNYTPVLHACTVLRTILVLRAVPFHFKHHVHTIDIDKCCMHDELA